jgi:hypothetical protein
VPGENLRLEHRLLVRHLDSFYSVWVTNVKEKHSKKTASTNLHKCRLMFGLTELSRMLHVKYKVTAESKRMHAHTTPEVGAQAARETLG